MHKFPVTSANYWLPRLYPYHILYHTGFDTVPLPFRQLSEPGRSGSVLRVDQGPALPRVANSQKSPQTPQEGSLYATDHQRFGRI